MSNTDYHDPDYDYWLAKLAGQDPDPQADRSAPPCGRWRTQGGKPLAVWRNGHGNIVAVIGTAPERRKLTNVELMSMGEVGSHGTAITDEVYDAVVNGAPWPDMDLTLAKHLAEAAKVGHNQPPQDPFQVLSEQIETVRGGTSDYVEINSDEQAARAQSLRVRLNELSRAADREREQLKKPHLEAGKAIDAKWGPLVRLAKDAADYLVSKMSAWENAKARKARAEADERAKAEEEAAERDITLPPSEPAPAPSEAPQRIRGAYGRAAPVKTVRVLEITNWAAAAAFFAFDPGVQEAIKKAGQRAIAVGQPIPADVGTVREEKKVG